MKNLIKKTLISTAILASSYAQADILVSVKPIGFIASSIADGIVNTDVLVPMGASPHDYSLKPQDIQKIKNADLLIWIGEDVDSFINKTSQNIEKSKQLRIADLEIIKPLLTQGEHHHHDHDGNHHHDKDDHDELETNWHIWYSPAISKVIAQQIADKLTAQYPAKKDLIQQNLAQFNQGLNSQSEQIKTQLSPFHHQGFYVFHDAYSYFNDAYGLNQTGAFTINPLVAPGAKTIAHIKEEIEEHKVSCLFAEPQFTPKVIETLQQKTGVKVGQLDPMGDKVNLGKNSYANFLQYTADSYKACLSK